ncbi:hypothetical protein [Singulisphaera acidiphila]|uniref:Plasmid related protein n=1 Tax=Singulisphaera acidiphila (strain ATCC BAA-1392 / DSM 18658 / VKM B-2454 / MOB10) TaxID=886293 RepID=L0DTI6_SINAD|nr:hypothetical protein [Singulisphaera acidiphila]AGA31686.1 hypothetical protein Sinac_7657 [Singulisphaera acidiphila DSM 18658]
MDGFAAINIICLKLPKFPLGDTVITTNAESLLDPVDVQQGLSRHADGDWGEIPSEDRQLNECSLKQGGRLLSVYRSGGKRFWIITEADRSVTTVLMPEDY